MRSAGVLAARCSRAARRSARCSSLRRPPAGAPPAHDAAQRLLRSDPRAVRGFQRRVCPLLEGEDRSAGARRAVARRLGHAGALGHRRARRGCRDAGARGRHRRHRRAAASSCRSTGRAGCPTTARPTPRRSSSLVRKGNPEGHPRLGRSGAAGRVGHHAQPQDLRRRALELPGRLGAGRARSRAATMAARAEFVRRLYRNVPVLDAGARGATTTFVHHGLGDVLHRLGERGAARRARARRGQARRSSCPR